MSGDRRLTVVHHLAGLAFVAGIIACLAAIWVYGLAVLRGTIFNDLSLIIYAVLAFGFLSLAERIAKVWPRR